MSKSSRRGQGTAVARMRSPGTTFASWRLSGDQGCAISLYLSLDPSDVPTSADVETRANSLLSEANRRLLEERKASLAASAREALKHDIERIKAWFDDGFDRHGVRGVAVFAAGLDNLWSTLPLPDPVGDTSRSAASSVSRRSRGSSGAHEGAARRLPSAASGASCSSSKAAPRRDRRPDRGGARPARPGRLVAGALRAAHRRDRRAALAPRSAETLDACVARRGARRAIVLVGAEDMRSDFEELLSTRSEHESVGWTAAEAHADAPQLLEASARCSSVVERSARGSAYRALARGGRASNGRAATGWDADARGRLGRPRRAAARAGRGRPAGVPVSRVRPRADGGRRLSARRHDAESRRRAGSTSLCTRRSTTAAPST